MLSSYILILSEVLNVILLCTVVLLHVKLLQRKKNNAKDILALRNEFSTTLLHSKLEIQEQTLDHISRELHANFSHLASLININLSVIPSQNPNEAKESILETKSLAKQMLSDLKSLSASLNTDLITHIGFQAALTNELERISKAKKYRLSFSQDGKAFRLHPEPEIILFRLCQEVINNIVMHARAKAITVSISYFDDYFILTITDDGTGFDMEAVDKQRAERQSTGLLNISKRAKLINADLNISSEAGIGTSIQIKIAKTK